MSRICFVSYEIHPTTWGGCGVLIHHLAERLLLEGHEICLLLDIPHNEFQAFTEKDRFSFPANEKLSVYAVNELCEDFPHSAADIPNVFQAKALCFAHALRKVVAKEKPDFVEFFEYCGAGLYAFARKLYGLDFQNTILGTRLHTSVELMDRTEATKPVDEERYVMYGMERLGLHFAEAVLAPSQTFFEAYYRSFYGLPAEQVEISAPPLKLLPPPPACTPSDRRQIVFLGRIYQLKGVEQLVHAGILLLQRHEDWPLQFVLMGNDSQDSPTGGSYTEYLKKLIPARYRPHFVFTGHLPHGQVAMHLAEAECAVFPNQFESFCYALHEVAHAGVPIIANDLPAFRDALRDEQEALFYDGTMQGLLRAMERMLQDEPLRQRLAQARPALPDHSTCFYEYPQPLCSLANNSPASGKSINPLVIVLARVGQLQLAQLTHEALERQCVQNFTTITLIEMPIDSEGAFFWLGHSWLARQGHSDRFDFLQANATDTLLLLQAGDVPAPNWMEVCQHALAARTNMAFAGTWQAAGDCICPSSWDVAPEEQPFLHGAEPARVLMRTPPGTLLLDLFDDNLGSLGETGFLWKAIAQHGPGLLLPEPWMQTQRREAKPANHAQLGYLVARYGKPFRERLALFNSAIFYGQPAVRLSEPYHTVQQKYASFKERLAHATFSARPHQTNGAPDEASLLQRVGEMRAELDYIKARASYRLPVRLRATRVYSLLRWLKADKNQLATIRALGRHHAQSLGDEVWLLSARVSETGDAIPWDYFARPKGNWHLVERAEGPWGKAFEATQGELKFMLHGEQPVLEFLSHPWSGQVEIEYGGRKQIVDLYSAEPRNVRIYPAPNNRNGDATPPVTDAPSAPGAPAILQPIQFQPHEQAWLERMQQTRPHTIALHVPRWMGVSASTCTLFEHTLPFPWSAAIEPYGIEKDEIRRYAHLVLESGARHVVASGGDRIQLNLLSYLKQQDPSIRCDLLWHGTYVQFSEDYNWQVLRLWIDAARKGLVHTLATVKKGQELFFRDLGCRSAFLMNYVPHIPTAASHPDPGGPHLGIWLSGDTYRKLPYAMLSAARMIPGAVVHGSNFSARATEAMEYFGVARGGIAESSLSSDELLQAIRRTHLSLYVTFAECTPMLPLESLSVGVPCLLGNTSHLFEDNDYLYRRLVVSAPDRADVISRHINKALEEREAIVRAYADYAPIYNEQARQSVRAFVESD